MARYTESVCRLCRRENDKLFLKGERCQSDKCAFSRRKFAPGQHGIDRRKETEYGLQLRQKQKVRRVYGVLEKQFRLYFQEADRQKGETGKNLLVLLERRLDSVVCRLGFATTRAEARQLVRHGHFRVNGHKVNIPSFLVKVGDTVELRERSRQVKRFLDNLEAASRSPLPSWLELDKDSYKGILRSLPIREELTAPEFREQLIVELYSK